jgi:hypothetical protein
MKVPPAMLLKTRSGCGHFATHPVMCMKTNGFPISPDIIEYK